jgi:hypothetical protein
VKRISAILFCSVLSGLLLPTVHADSGLAVTSGVFTIDTAGVIDVSGQAGLHMVAAVSTAGGRFAPWNQCSDLECVPGTVVSLGAAWTSPDLGGDLSIRGKQYRLGVEGAAGAGGSVEFNGSVTLPDFNGNNTIEVTGPFTLTGQLHYPDVIGGNDDVLSGQGTATLTMRLSADGSAWQYVSARYVFEKK